jgi:hypothetical protein
LPFEVKKVDGIYYALDKKSKTGLLNDDYPQLVSIDGIGIEDLHQVMDEFKDTDGLVIDIRGNGVMPDVLVDAVLSDYVDDKDRVLQRALDTMADFTIRRVN